MHYLVRGIVYGVAFAVVEAMFRALCDNDEHGKLVFAPNWRHGHSTWAMLPGSMLGGLYFLEPCYFYCRPFADPAWNLALRLALWPVVIWAIELVWGAFLYYGCNGTRAWHYQGATARCNGFIKLSYYPYWLILGIAVEAWLYWLSEL